jgi:hypothetical protein
MSSEQRRKPRKPLRHTVWVQVRGEKPTGAVMSDISDSGARLDVREPDGIPDRFIMLLSKNGQARRMCRVVWRSDRQLGVQFEKHAEG